MTRPSLRPPAGVALLLLLASPAGGEGIPAPRPLGRELPLPAASPADAEAGTAASTDTSRHRRFVEPEGVIGRRDALVAALLGSPALAAAAVEVRAREAERVQAGFWPNPTANLEVEDIGTAQRFAGAQASQTTLRLGQRFELGGEREAREHMAAGARDLAGWSYESARVDVLADTAQAFYAVLEAQRALALRQQVVGVIEELLRVAERRVGAGAAPALERTRSRVALARARLAADEADLELDHARHSLSSRWGTPVPRFERAEGDLERLPVLPDRASLLAKLSDSPALARFESEETTRRARLALEQARSIPDVTLVAGPRWIASADEATLVAQVQLPLPLWDRNQGNIAAARHRLAKLAYERRAARVRAESAFVDAYETLAGALVRDASLRDHVVPGAIRAVQEAREGWEAGRFPYREVFDAERSEITARISYVEALATAHREAAELERVLAAPLASTSPHFDGGGDQP